MKTIREYLTPKYKENYYFQLMCLIIGIISVLTIMTELKSVPDSWKLLVIGNRIFTFVVCLLLVFVTISEELKEKHIIILSINYFFYILVGIWFGPLYEIAYAQFAIASIFLKTMKKQTFIIMNSVIVISILISHAIQSKINWEPIHPSNFDLAFIIVTFYGIVYVINRFHFQSEKMSSDLNYRFVFIGKETTKILHDLKGYLINPLILSEITKNQTDEIQIKQNLLQIENEVLHIQSVINNINNLVNTDIKPKKIHLKNFIDETIEAFKREKVKMSVIEEAPDLIIKTIPSRLKNLLNLTIQLLMDHDQNRNSTDILQIEVKIEKKHISFCAENIQISENIFEETVSNSNKVDSKILIIQSEMQILNFNYLIKKTDSKLFINFLMK